MPILIVFAATASEVVPWALTAGSVIAGCIAALASRSAAKAQKESVSTSAFEAVTKSQATYNLQLANENGALRALLQANEEKCRADIAALEEEVSALESELVKTRGEVVTLRMRVRTLEGHT